jgi:hypothetical protein
MLVRAWRITERGRFNAGLVRVWLLTIPLLSFYRASAPGRTCIVSATLGKCPAVHAGLPTASCLSAVRRLSQGRALLAVTVTLSAVAVPASSAGDRQGRGCSEAVDCCDWTCKPPAPLPDGPSVHVRLGASSSEQCSGTTL